MQRRRGFLFGFASCALCGCSGAVHRLPSLSSTQLSVAQNEVTSSNGLPSRKDVPDAEAVAMMQSALERIQPAADALCAEMKAGVCEWTFRASRDRTLNASARDNGLIVVNRGIVEYASNIEEIALVIGHEIGHHAANHIATTKKNAAIGTLIGAMILGAAGAYASRGSYYASSNTRDAMEVGADLGGAVGRISFSKEQEREADYIAAAILYRSGLDLNKARGFLVTLARASGRTETGMLDTHPAGPERIAGWDQAVQELRFSKGRMPPRAA